MKKYFASAILFILAVGALVGCGNSTPTTLPPSVFTPTPTPMPTATVLPSPTNEIMPTATQSDTPAFVPTAAPTAEITPSPTPAPTQDNGPRTATLKKGTDALRIRGGKGTDTQILGRIIEGDSFDVTDMSDSKWYRVNYGGIIGYVSADYVILGGAATPTPAPTPTPVYSGNLDVITLDSLSNEPNGWGLPLETNGKIPQVPSKTARMFKQYDGICQMDANSKNVYLTFDCGYENGYTSVILDALKEKNCKAVFFLTYDYVKKNDALVRRMIDEGHKIGNHSMTHANLTKVSYEKLEYEIKEFNRIFEEKYGVKINYMRPPEGVFSERVLAATQMLGMKTVLWDFAYADWDTSKQKGPDYAHEKVMKHIHNGSVLLLHAVSSSNAQAMGRIIDSLRDAGYNPVLLEI